MQAGSYLLQINYYPEGQPGSPADNSLFLQAVTVGPGAVNASLTKIEFPPTIVAGSRVAVNVTMLDNLGNRHRCQADWGFCQAVQGSAGHVASGSQVQFLRGCEPSEGINFLEGVLTKSGPWSIQVNPIYQYPLPFTRNLDTQPKECNSKTWYGGALR